MAALSGSLAETALAQQDVKSETKNWTSAWMPGSAVDFTYKLPFEFTGGIYKLTFELK
jgi:hypothetical protein